MRKIGITGGGGFIGQYVCEELIKRDYTPVVFDHHNKGNLLKGCELFIGDVQDEIAMTEFAAHVDGIIHLAACLGTQETIKNPRPAAKTNLMGGLNFLEACAQYELPGVYIAVGNYYMNNPYSITKNMIERFTYMYNKDRGTKVNIVRAVNAYGPRQLAATPYAEGKVRKITPAFICRALCGQSIEIYGDGSNVSDMVYVGDVAKALVNALEYAEKGITFNEAIECGPKTHHTVKEVAELVNELTDNKAPIKYLPMRPGEQSGVDVTANFSTLNNIGMDVLELTPIDEGMKKTVQYFKDSEGVKWHKP
jgi:UDP-glucose 4-epimerase